MQESEGTLPYSKQHTLLRHLERNNKKQNLTGDKSFLPWNNFSFTTSPSELEKKSKNIVNVRLCDVEESILKAAESSVIHVSASQQHSSVSFTPVSAFCPLMSSLQDHPRQNS